MSFTAFPLIWLSLFSLWFTSGRPVASPDKDERPVVVQAKGKGNPNITLADGTNIFPGSAAFGGPQGRVMAAADLDSDGSADLRSRSRQVDVCA
jgi:hypothetical protein